MTIPPKERERLIRASRAAVGDVLGFRNRLAAWESLQERDASGAAKGPLPYAPQALREYQAAFKQTPDDPGLVHHLAIATHALAWDLELKQSPAAASAWEKALEHWRIIAASTEFWEGLKAKLLTLKPDADLGRLDEVRRNLLENLLDVHVDFVRHYCEKGQRDRATMHVRIVARAKIPPAVKSKLADRVFTAMADLIPDARAKGEYESALLTLDHFLDLFPQSLRALRMYAEVCQDCVQPLSWRDDWDKILEIGMRAKPQMKFLAAHAALDDEPLAQAALEGFCGELARKGHDRGWSFIAAVSEASGMDLEDREAAEAAFSFAIEAGRTGCRRGGPDASQIADCLRGRAVLQYAALKEAVVSDDTDEQKLIAARHCCRSAIKDLRDAIEYQADDEELNALLNRDLMDWELSQHQFKRPHS